jgi:hypothetical protein
MRALPSVGPAIQRVRSAWAEVRWNRALARALDVPEPPVTFNDKVRHRMLRDRCPLLATFVDKVAVRDYVAGRVGEEFLTKLHLVTKDADAVRPDALPREFVVKASHGSGGCVLVADCAFSDDRLPEPPVGWHRYLVRPDVLDWGTLRGLLRDWLARRYGKWEWAYRRVPGRILVEELLLHEGAIPRDYKFFVFDGRVRHVHVDFDRFTRHLRTLYTPEWELVPGEYGHPQGPEIGRPAALDQMISLAEELGAGIDFVRVDLYALDDRVVVGELTPYPLAGLGRFRPASLDRELGAWWSLPSQASSEIPNAR